MLRIVASALIVTMLCGPWLRAQERDRPPATGKTLPELAPLDELMVDFVRRHKVPGAALAVAKDGRLVYVRGFGYADPARRVPVQLRSRFRIASISKPITAAAILLLAQQGKLKLDEPVVPLLRLPADRRHDVRLGQVTVRQVLQHSGGWDSKASFDPMFRSVRIARDFGAEPPASADQIVRFMLDRELDFAPGSRYAYSNFGYCLLGRVMQTVSGQPYEKFVQREILRPLGIRDMQIGKTLEQADGEVRYIDEQGRTGPCVFGPRLGQQVPLPYGAWCLEAMDAHGGWIASAPDLVRFAAALDPKGRPSILDKVSLETMFARPDGLLGHDNKDNPLDVYYGCGWQVRRVGARGVNYWHAGALDGTATLLVHRHDGFTWAVLFNTRSAPDGTFLIELIDPLLHRAVDGVRMWPAVDLFAGDEAPGR